MTFEKRVLEIIKNNLENKSEITLKTNLKDELGIDSFGLLMIINAFEDEFGISIKENDFKNLRTPEDIANKLKSEHPEAVKG